MISATHGGGFKTYNRNILKQLFINSDDNEYYIYTNDKSLHSTNDKINLINYFSENLHNIFSYFIDPKELDKKSIFYDISSMQFFQMQVIAVL